MTAPVTPNPPPAIFTFEANPAAPVTDNVEERVVAPLTVNAEPNVDAPVTPIPPVVTSKAAL